jgi:4-carboxymuconolactone decarboxylase
MAQSQPSSARDQVRNIVPGLIDLSERVLFGEVWERPGLSKRDRSLITCATLIALGREKQLVGHLQRALDNGLTKNELSEVITHLAFYAGWPAAMTAALVAKDVFEKHWITLRLTLGGRDEDRFYRLGDDGFGDGREPAKGRT